MCANNMSIGYPGHKFKNPEKIEIIGMFPSILPFCLFNLIHIQDTVKYWRN